MYDLIDSSGRGSSPASPALLHEAATWGLGGGGGRRNTTGYDNHDNGTNATFDSHPVVKI